MPVTGIDETVKQEILRRNTFDGMDGLSSIASLRSRRSSRNGSRRQSRVQFDDTRRESQTLDLPTTSNGKVASNSLV